MSETVKPTIAALRAWLKTCPLIAEEQEATGAAFRIAGLEEESTAFSIEDSPGDPIITEYISGWEMAKNYLFLSRREYSEVDAVSIASGDFKGEPGTSPTVTVQDIAGGHRIVITDATGTSSVDVMDGKQGDPGKDATVDTTLTHEGEAADAKATGDAISAVKARQNALVGSETGNSFSVDDAFSAPLCGLTVYGRSTQDGTPTPDAPVPIVSAGDGGSVAVTLSNGDGKTQTLTLSTPNGLPGIPVTFGGNYTDSTGQQWVCDEVDLERGVKVQRVGKTQVNTKNGTPEETHRLRIPFSGNGKRGNFDCIISVTPFTSWTSCVNYHFLYLKNVPKSDGSFYTGEELKALAIDVDVVYQLATPIETPLTPDEIAAYKALAVHGPDTVVQAGDGAGIRLDYQRDVNIAIKKLEDAIASMT